MVERHSISRYSLVLLLLSKPCFISWITTIPFKWSWEKQWIHYHWLKTLESVFLIIRKAFGLWSFNKVERVRIFHWQHHGYFWKQRYHVLFCYSDGLRNAFNWPIWINRFHHLQECHDTNPLSMLEHLFFEETQFVPVQWMYPVIELNAGHPWPNSLLRYTNCSDW